MENIIRVRDKSFNVEKMETSRNSGGRLDKIWIRDTDNIRYLIKSSNTFGQEPYSEVMAYIIGKVLGFNVLEYQLIEANYFKDYLKSGIFCKHVSICRDINQSDYKVTTVTNLKNQINLMSTYTQSNREVMESVLSKEYIDLMLFFDAIIGNKDRHYRNVHLYRDNYGNIREAPLLDNGDSLMATDILRSTSALGSYMANKFNKSATIARTHDKQMEYITTIRTNGINGDSLARECILAIEPILKYMDAGRTSAIRKYLIYRIHKYYGLLK